MSSVRTQILFIIFLVVCFAVKNISGLHDKKTKNKEGKKGQNATSINKIEPLSYWDPQPANSEERLRRSNRRGWFDSSWNSRALSHSSDINNEKIINAKTENVTVSANVSGVTRDAHRSRFGLHEGLRVRFSRNGARQGGKERDTKSTRIAPMHLMQQEPEHPKIKEKQEQNQQETYKGKQDVFDGDPFILSPYAIEEQISKLLLEFDDAEFTTEVVGRTASYIDIIMFKISKKGSNYFRAHEDQFVENEVKEKKVLFIVHALSPMGMNHLYTLTLEHYLRRLIGYYLEHLDKFDIYFIPLGNPDGYATVRNIGMEAVWNKNNAMNADCKGVNVDRNFDVAWNTTVLTSSCSQHYPGVIPFSEPESRAVRDVFHHKSHKIAAYFHVHGGTYNKKTFKGDAVLYPRGFTDHQSDDDKYVDLKAEIDEAMKNANFKVLTVTVDTLYNWYGKVSGTSVDYAATVYGIPYAMELVMQLYIDAYKLYWEQLLQPTTSNSTLEDHSLEQIWRRVINVIFTNIYKKIEGGEI